MQLARLAPLHPPDRAAVLTDVELSDVACAGVTATCDEEDAGLCLRYQFMAIAAGNCHVDVDFSSGPARFSADVTIVPGGCCGGFYASPPSAGDIEVPSAAALDAGGGG